MPTLTNITLTSTTPVTLPVGNVAARLNDNAGSMRFNTESRSVEHWDGTLWAQLNPIGKQVFQYTGYQQSFTVPLGVTAVLAKCWGAGGGSGSLGGWYIGSPGGGGGFMSGVIPVTPDEDLLVIVGQQGRVNAGTYAYGGGGKATNNGSDNRYAGGGGGYSGVFRSTINQAGALVMAGGGGGGGASRTTSTAVAPQTDAQFVSTSVNNGGSKNYGGGGGGLVARNGSSAYDNKPLYSGIGGNTSVGAGANATSDSANGGGEQGAMLGGSPRTNSYGGGGGGGFWGGSAGGYSESYTMSGGGGGCGQFAGTTIPVSSSTGYFISPGAAGLVDPDYIFPVGYGGVMNTGSGAAPPQGQDGGHGLVVVYFYK